MRGVRANTSGGQFLYTGAVVCLGSQLEVHQAGAFLGDADRGGGHLGGEARGGVFGIARDIGVAEVGAGLPPHRGLLAGHRAHRVAQLPGLLAAQPGGGRIADQTADVVGPVGVVSLTRRGRSPSHRRGNQWRRGCGGGRRPPGFGVRSSRPDRRTPGTSPSPTPDAARRGPPTRTTAPCPGPTQQPNAPPAEHPPRSALA